LSVDRVWNYTTRYLENFDFSERRLRVMMRDYKFRQTEWPRRKARSKMLRIVAVLLAVVALGLLGYAALQWFSQKPTAEGPSVEPHNPRVVPLAIPPKAPAETTSPAEPSTRPGQD
jgi:hypothetical protein